MFACATVRYAPSDSTESDKHRMTGVPPVVRRFPGRGLRGKLILLLGVSGCLGRLSESRPSRLYLISLRTKRLESYISIQRRSGGVMRKRALDHVVNQGRIEHPWIRSNPEVERT